MSQIVFEGLVKTFRIAERQAGMAGALRGIVHRRHRSLRALDGVSFTLEAGDLVGYIGPNGAGKSTTVKILAGILVPDGARCEVLGRVPWRERIANAREIGVVFGQRTQLWWDLPVIESFDLLRDIYSVHQRDYLRARDELVALLDLEAILDVPVRQPSLGQRMRCDLTASLLHAPSLLYLDEPTIGLDAVSKLAVRDFVKRLNRERDVTIILTTHDMDDIEALCRRVIVIDEGQILSDGTLDALRRSVSRERWLTIDRHRRGCPARLRHVSFPGQERRFSTVSSSAPEARRWRSAGPSEASHCSSRQSPAARAFSPASSSCRRPWPSGRSSLSRWSTASPTAVSKRPSTP